MRLNKYQFKYIDEQTKVYSVVRVKPFQRTRRIDEEDHTTRLDPYLGEVPQLVTPPTRPTSRNPMELHRLVDVMFHTARFDSYSKNDSFNVMIGFTNETLAEKNALIMQGNIQETTLLGFSDLAACLRLPIAVIVDIHSQEDSLVYEIYYQDYKSYFK